MILMSVVRSICFFEITLDHWTCMQKYEFSRSGVLPRFWNRICKKILHSQCSCKETNDLFNFCIFAAFNCFAPKNMFGSWSIVPFGICQSIFSWSRSEVFKGYILVPTYKSWNTLKYCIIMLYVIVYIYITIYNMWMYIFYLFTEVKLYVHIMYILYIYIYILFNLHICFIFVNKERYISLSQIL